MTDHPQNAPERIYLPILHKAGSVSWIGHQRISNKDIEYIRADLVAEHKELIHDLIGLVESMRIYCYEYKADQIKKIIERARRACE